MTKNSRSAYRWYFLVLNLGISVFLIITVYGAILRWVRTPYFFTIVQKLLGAGVDMVAIALLFMSQLHIIWLSQRIRANTIFSPAALQNARGAFFYFLCWTLYVPFQRALEVLIATMHNPVGYRFFIFTFSMPDLVRMMVLTILAFLIFVLQRGIDLANDQSLTI